MAETVYHEPFTRHDEFDSLIADYSDEYVAQNRRLSLLENVPPNMPDRYVRNESQQWYSAPV